MNRVRQNVKNIYWHDIHRNDPGPPGDALRLAMPPKKRNGIEVRHKTRWDAKSANQRIAHLRNGLSEQPPSLCGGVGTILRATSRSAPGTGQKNHAAKR